MLEIPLWWKLTYYATPAVVFVAFWIIWRAEHSLPQAAAFAAVFLIAILLFLWASAVAMDASLRSEQLSELERIDEPPVPMYPPDCSWCCNQPVGSAEWVWCMLLLGCGAMC